MGPNAEFGATEECEFLSSAESRKAKLQSCELRLGLVKEPYKVGLKSPLRGSSHLVSG